MEMLLAWDDDESVSLKYSDVSSSSGVEELDTLHSGGRLAVFAWQSFLKELHVLILLLVYIFPDVDLGLTAPYSTGHQQFSAHD